MGAAGDDSAVVDEHDSFGEGDRRESVGDQDRGPIGAAAGQRLVKLLFDGDIDGARGVVENENRRIGHEGAGDGQSLALAAGDRRSALTELGVDTNDIALLGGGARSSLWGQIRADVSERLVRVTAEIESCARGAALLAAVAVGAQASIEAASEAVASFGQSFQPSADMGGAYRRYSDLFASLTRLFELD